MDMARVLDAAKDLVARALEQHRTREHLRYAIGKVTVVDSANKRVTVLLSGDATATTRIPYNLDLTLAVNDYVVVLIQNSRQFMVVCRTSAIP